MTDLHSHILPCIDDGASSIEMALQLLKIEQNQGIDKIALTSHFYCNNMILEEFLEKRAMAFQELNKAIQESKIDVTLKLGSEVRFSPKLIKMDVTRLCLDGTNVMLLELPTSHKPQFLKEGLEYFYKEGIIPLIAHVERYPYVIENPTLLTDWIEQGAYIQMNAEALFCNDSRKKMIHKFIKWELVDVIASDAHSPHRRPPIIEQALHEVEKRFGKSIQKKMECNAEKLFNGEALQVKIPYRPKLIGLWWY